MLTLQRFHPVFELLNRLRVWQQRIFQLKHGALAGLQLFHATLFTLNRHRIRIVGARFNTGDISLFQRVSVFPQRQQRKLMGIELNRCAFITGFVDDARDGFTLRIRLRHHVEDHFIEAFGWPA